MTESGRGTTIAVWVLSGLLAALFIFAGGSKIFGTEAAQHFVEWGLPAWFCLLIGLLEVAGGMGLLIPSLAFYAAAGLGVVMIGAVYTVVTNGAPGVPIPIICLVLLAVVAYFRRGSIRN